jgi:hypothetical protein
MGVSAGTLQHSSQQHLLLLLVTWGGAILLADHTRSQQHLHSYTSTMLLQALGSALAACTMCNQVTALLLLLHCCTPAC